MTLPAETLNEANDDLEYGDQIVVVIVRADKSTMPYDVRWSEGLTMGQLSEIPEQVEIAVQDVSFD